MYISMFDIQGNKIILNTDELAIPPFKDYYNNSNDKAKAIKEIEYVIWLYKWDSPYLSYDSAMRASIVGKDVMSDSKYRPSDDLQELSRRFNEFQQTPLTRLYQASEEALEWLTQTLQNIRSEVDQAELGIEDKMKVATSISKLVKDVEANAKSVDSAKKRAMAEQVEAGRITGGGKLGLYERPHK